MEKSIFRMSIFQLLQNEKIPPKIELAIVSINMPEPLMKVHLKIFVL